MWARSVNTSGLQSDFTGSAHDTLKQLGTINIKANSIRQIKLPQIQSSRERPATKIAHTQIAIGTITGDRIAAGTITAATGDMGDLAVDTLQIKMRR